MGTKVTVEIPDEIYQLLKRQAESAERDIAEVVAESLVQKQRGAFTSGREVSIPDRCHSLILLTSPK